MSHYTSIKTKYTNSKILKKVINKLGYPYIEHKLHQIIEVPIVDYDYLKSSIYDTTHRNYLAFKYNKFSYDIITDSQSWTQKEILSTFLKKLELNYGYAETIYQALDLGFVRSRVITMNKKHNRFIFQRFVETKL
uniref:Ycf35 n=1 Tax=Coccophora langsdorfii TaxID=74099 RepID=A0A1L2F1K4_9PHAE|nr:Ycf35 [Coccophora langsdorfii]ANS72223.1 Ycf35 [Coccophora langsdorfii]